MPRLGLVVTLSLFVAVVVEPAARACSPMPSGYLAERTVLPFDGFTGVPTNARVLVTYRGTGPLGADSPRLRVSTGGEVAASVTLLDASGIQRQTYLVQPAAPLQPNTVYEVLSKVAQIPCMANYYWRSNDPWPPCNPVSDGGVAAADAGDAGAGSAMLTVISTFTTGAGPDTTPPVLSGSLTHTSQKWDCDSSACCGPYTGYIVAFSWQNASETGIVYYELARGSATVLSGFGPVAGGSSSPGNVAGEFFCSGIGSMGPELFTGVAGNYALVAIDLAGNRSGAITDQVTIDCSAFYDGGTAPDHSPAVDARADAPILVDAAPDAAVVGIDGAAAVGSDAEIYDVGTTQPARSDASVDASGPAGPVPAKGSGGCSCRLAGRSIAVNGWGIAAFALLLVLRGRRRLR